VAKTEEYEQISGYEMNFVPNILFPAPGLPPIMPWPVYKSGEIRRLDEAGKIEFGTTYESYDVSTTYVNLGAITGNNNMLYFGKNTTTPPDDPKDAFTSGLVTGRDDDGNGHLEYGFDFVVSEDFATAAATGAGGTLGASAGGWAGAKLGAMAGTAIAPGVGTVVGGVVGAGIGAGIAYFATTGGDNVKLNDNYSFRIEPGAWIEPIQDSASDAVDTLTDIVDDAVSAAEDTVEFAHEVIEKVNFAKSKVDSILDFFDGDTTPSLQDAHSRLQALMN
jgi:hypothetical protein